MGNLHQCCGASFGHKSCLFRPPSLPAWLPICSWVGLILVILGNKEISLIFPNLGKYGEFTSELRSKFRTLITLVKKASWFVMAVRKV